jgi:hypothetical protein
LASAATSSAATPLFAAPPWNEVPVGAHSGHAVSCCIWDVAEIANKQLAGVEAVGQVWEESLVLVAPLGTVYNWPIGVDEGESVTGPDDDAVQQAAAEMCA